MRYYVDHPPKMGGGGKEREGSRYEEISRASAMPARTYQGSVPAGRGRNYTSINLSLDSLQKRRWLGV